MFGDKGKWLLLNPVAPLLDGLSTCMVRHESPDLHWYMYSLAFSMAAFMGGFIMFKHLEPAFAESI
jgi:ABC-type polysaccharide/polyol phosphate export permease